ncbi:MAG: hypothetical protein ABIJ26_01075 [Candidatus Margulisiibacteriota bacterium]|nr:hypothetical protein [Candidatus Margulisiibacteriota bacterium]
MKKFTIIAGLFFLFAMSSAAQLSFYLIDNFEDGTFSKWFVFDRVQPKIIMPPSVDKKDLIAESCGEYALQLKGSTTDWYVGGIGTNLTVDANEYSRLQLDMFGSPYGGKVKIELYEDDNGNSIIEQDESNNWSATKDDIWFVELPILGEGYTRFSIPFSAFKDANPGVGDDKFNPDKMNNSGGLLRVQLVFVADQKEGEIEAVLDNVLLTY